MHRGAGIVVLMLCGAIGACSSSGGGLVAVQGALGVMDCPSDLHHTSYAAITADAVGSETADAALARLTTDLGLPPGVPGWESSSGTADRVVYLFRDSEGHRLGRAEVVLSPNGWFVVMTERCS